jgi:hypothetical protein
MLAPHSRRPPPIGLALAAIGLGVALWYGYDLVRAPTMSDEQIAQLVEVNLAADVARQPEGSRPSEAQLAPLAAQMRAEITGEIARTRSQARTGLIAGLAAAAFGILQMLLLRRPRGAGDLRRAD